MLVNTLNITDITDIDIDTDIDSDIDPYNKLKCHFSLSILHGIMHSIDPSTCYFMTDKFSYLILEIVK